MTSKVGDPALAEDLFQDSLLNALRQAGDLRETDRLLPWFYRILNNAVVDHYRQRAVAARYLPQLAADGASDLVPEEKAALCECFVELLPTLKPGYAELIRRLEETCRICAEHACLDCTCRRPPAAP